MHLVFALLAVLPVVAAFGERDVPHEPLFRTVDLNRGEAQEVELSNGTKAKVKLLEVEERRDSLRSAVRQARVKVEINGSTATLTSGNYQLPLTVAGVQIDCPITSGYNRNRDPFENSWGLDKEARLRLWPAGSPLMVPGTFVYPAKQRWFASPTQMGNEPAYVDGGDRPPAERPIYYHSGNDIGGCEGLVDVLSACDGLVVSSGGKAMPKYSDAPFYKPRGDYDYVYVVDGYGWFYRYAHLQSIDPAVQPGKRVKMGQKIGVLGKEGSSGGWAHLHFDIKAKQPSGKWGIEDAYPFLWEAYQSEHKPQLVAIARPHHLIAAGEKVILDGSRSWSAAGQIGRYQWTFGDGSTAGGALVERTYKQPGSYSEILKVTDDRGRIDYDFATVQVIDKDRREKFPPTIHASYAPTFGIRAGDPVMFKVRTFRVDAGNELWDFGDGSEPVRVHSDGNAKPHNAHGYAETVHRFAKPGHYVVRVEGTGHAGAKAIAHLQVRVGEKERRNQDSTTFEITIAAGLHERRNTPVRVQVPPGQIGDEKRASVTLTGPDGKAIPAQLTKPSLIRGGGSELHFILPHLLPGESVRLKATVSTDSPSGAESFAWHDHAGDHTDLFFGKRPVLSYVYHRFDETSKSSRDRTYKVFHHLYSPQGDTVVTNGLPDDPKIHSPHHRGIFYGFNRISYGNGKTADLWHCTNGSYQEHDRFLSSEAGPVLGRHLVAISWHGEDRKTFAEEERELTVYNVPGGQLVEFASRLKSPAGPVKFDGDPQHAGFQFRTHNDVDAKTSKETIYVRTDGVGKPDETRNWGPKTREGPVNLPWNAMSFVLKGKRYTAAYLDHPRNPKEARFSERAFGRFGSYFEYTVDERKPLTVNYRLWLQEGQMKPEEVAVLSKDFVDPVEKQRGGADTALKDDAALLWRIPPKSPAEALKAFQVHPGFRVELAAAEPLLASPVALDFDDDGRLYVAEFPEFNQNASKQPHGHGHIRLLEDTDGNGVYDKSTIFLDNLDSPVAVCCYDGGVFVGAVPNILYAKDTDGDGKGDVLRVVFTGFARDVGGEAMMNSFRWMFDNRIHVSTSFSGGEVRHAARKDARPVSARGQLFIFDPRTESFEVTSGGGQHGMSMDDWGRTFVCTNHDPINLIMYDGRYLARNPYLEAPAAALEISPGGYGAKVRRISANEPWRVVRTRWRTQGIEGETPHPTEGAEPSGFFTAASGITVYRGDAWPAEYRGNVFVGEVANNLLYRARLEPSGVGLTALRADRNVEFLASTDNWFRPVQMANGPDGALYVIDMYRNLIQAAAFLPPALLKHLDVSGGFDQGRLYRIVPEGFQRPKPPRLGKASTALLAALLEHPNGWHRDTASRLLYQRQDPSAVAPLEKLAALGKVPVGRMHALYALDGLKALDAVTVLHALHDPDPRVREHALRLAEQFESAPKIRARFAEMTDDADLRVRYQLAFSLGAVPGETSSRALAKLARRDGNDPWFRLAVLSSVNGRAGEVFRLLIEDQGFRASGHGRELLGTLATLIGSANRKNEMAGLIQGLNALPEREKALGRDLVRNLAAKLPPAGRGQLSGAGAGTAGAVLAGLLRDARKTAPDDKRPIADRAAALRTLGLAAFADVKDLFPDLLKSRQPQPVQAAALETLSGFDQPGVPSLLFEAWPGLSPALRSGAVEVLLARPAWVNAFVDAVEQGKVNRGDVDPSRIQVLQANADPQLRARAARLFGATKPARRQDVVAAYQKALQLKGDRARGKAVFKDKCSVCHQLESVGNQIGADLNAIRDQGTEAVLLNILDPNREVKPLFLTYVLLTDAGRVITGVITAETANSLTIRRADGTAETVLRIHIDELRSTGLSFMPEGLEKQIDVPAMADLLAYLNSIK